MGDLGNDYSALATKRLIPATRTAWRATPIHQQLPAGPSRTTRFAALSRLDRRGVPCRASHVPTPPAARSSVPA